MTGRRKYSKASKAASKALKGAHAPAEPIVTVSRPERNTSLADWFGWLNRPVMKGMRITWRAVMLFMMCCLILDVILYFVVQVGLGRCYGLLCLLG
ncbi:hypothetical protein DFP90_101193 [Aestuariispira insulae]|uniref:Uncharacterized protein n=1 Tax=Aestuariispira insulae TaxID=1461337 RepID=A0A3D9HVH0_9PROT|nr:hypothetical protein DFP90_101193 [Aestuariispira insulae]